MDKFNYEQYGYVTNANRENTHSTDAAKNSTYGYCRKLLVNLPRAIAAVTRKKHTQKQGGFNSILGAYSAKNKTVNTAKVLTLSIYQTNS